LRVSGRRAFCTTILPLLLNRCVALIRMLHFSGWQKMVEAGEDPRFIFRRMLIFAGEDVGMADPQALGVISSAAQAFDYVGMPEGRYHLAQACLYLSTATKK
jgi:Recombination protein MgsA